MPGGLPCGVYISQLQPFLAASPDKIFYLKDGSLGLIEIRRPFQVRHYTLRIVDACKDPLFCLEFDSNTEAVSLKMVCNHYELVGQLVISGACMGYFAVWTWRDMFLQK